MRIISRFENIKFPQIDLNETFHYSLNINDFFIIEKASKCLPILLSLYFKEAI